MIDSALVIGGTGPTGPMVVEGLLHRGYRVTIAHSGFHEVEFSQKVEHLHGDVHFTESLSDMLGNRTFDLVVAQYGRLAITSDLLAGRTGRIVAVGGAGTSAVAPDDTRWGQLGKPPSISEAETVAETDIAKKFQFRVAQAEDKFFEHHANGDYNGTLIAFPRLYGPRQMGPLEWCVVKRVLDRRPFFIVPDGGLKIETRGFTENAARAVLLAIDEPDRSAGQKYNFGDDNAFTILQRIELIARHLGHEWELIDLPYDLAKPSHVLWRQSRDHKVLDLRLIQDQLGYRDEVPQAEALCRTVDWLVANPPDEESNRQLSDPFDYAGEDRIVAEWQKLRAAFPDIPYEVGSYAHIYRHPKTPGEQWRHLDDRRSTNSGEVDASAAK